MNEIQSNYPRYTVSEAFSAEAHRMERWAFIGRILAVAYVSSVAIFDVSFLLQGAFDITSIIPFFQIVNSFLFFSIGIITTGWIYMANSIVCYISKRPSRFSSLKTAAICLLSPCLFFIPMSFVLEFLLIRSGNDSEPIMKWYRPISRSTIANVFLVTSALSIVLSLLPYLGYSKFLSFAAGLANCATILLGAKIIFEVNRNLRNRFTSTIEPNVI